MGQRACCLDGRLTEPIPQSLFDTYKRLVKVIIYTDICVDGMTHMEMEAVKEAGAPCRSSTNPTHHRQLQPLSLPNFPLLLCDGR